MSHFVAIASVLFSTKAEQGRKNAGEIVLKETADTLASLKGVGLDLVVFSEHVGAMGQRIEDAEEVDHPGPYLELYMDFAVSTKCHVAGSMKLAENGHVYNSIAFIGPEGAVAGVYHKVNLTIGEMEAGLTSGQGAVVVDTSIGRLGGAICFDLNFEDIRKQYTPLKPDILVFPSMYHGGLMQAIWAYQCRSYFVSALPFIGGGILDPFGRPVALTDCYTSIARARVNLDRVMVHLDGNRDKFPDIEKKYPDEVGIDIPPNVGSALITSHTDKRTAMDIVREFELELLDDYFQRARQANAENRV